MDQNQPFLFKSICSLALVLLFVNASFAQAPSQAEIDKMMKQAQEQMKKYGNDSTVNKVMKDAQNQQKQVSDAMKNHPQNNNTNNSLYADPSEYGNVDNWKFPAKNTAMLSSLPKKILTRTELISFLNAVYTQLSKKLPAGVASSVQSISAKYKNDGSRMGNAAISGWYTNYREESLLLIVKAAAANPDDGVLLNNCAALLNMSGVEHIAIPVLKYILQSYPSNAMVLNNLGQAYAGLGDTDTAMYYLGRCIKSDPVNVEANNTAGQIEAAKGNKDKAIDYFQQSLKGGYTKPAELKLRKIKKDSKIGPFIKPRVKVPEYFNQFKYQFPTQCTSVENAAEADAENIAFREILHIQQEVYLSKLSALQIRWTQLQMTGTPTGRRVIKGEFMAQPFAELCGIMARDLLADFIHDLGDIGPQGKIGKAHLDQIEALQKEYQQKYDVLKKGFDNRIEEGAKKGCCGEGNTSCCVEEEEMCRAYNSLANAYLPKFAAVMEDWQVKCQSIFKKYLDDLLYWSYLVFHNVPFGFNLAANQPPTDDFYRMNSFYPLITNYLVMIQSLAFTKIITPCHFTPTTATKDTLAIKETDCPLDISIPFVVGKINLSCEKFSISGGEGAVFSYEKDFKTKQSTVSVGIGLNLELGVKVGPVKGGVSAGVDESLFITFDGNNRFSDGGLTVSATAAAGADVGGVIKKGEGTSVGTTFGINSGCNFNEGFLKGKLGPAPEVQLNKNVNIYKPN